MIIGIRLSTAKKNIFPKKNKKNHIFFQIPEKTNKKVRFYFNCFSSKYFF